MRWIWEVVVVKLVGGVVVDGVVVRFRWRCRCWSRWRCGVVLVVAVIAVLLAVVRSSYGAGLL